MKQVYNAVAFLLVICCLAPSTMQALPPGQQLSAQKGVLDLRQLHPGKPFALKGEWAFYWKQLLTPAQFKKAGPPQHILFPSLWNNQEIGGNLLTAEGYATYGLTILLPSAREPLAMEIPDYYSSYALYVNGLLIANNGRPATSARDGIPYWTTTTVDLPPDADTLNLVLQVANFWHAKGGTYEDILIGDRKQLQLRKDQYSSLDLMLTGCLFMGGLFFLGLYFFGKNDKTILYFSLFCIVYSYRMIGTEIYVLHNIFPELSWFLTIRLEYLSLTLSVALFVQYIKCLFPLEVNALLVKVMTWFCVAFSLLVVFTTPLFFTGWLNIFLAAMFMYIAYAFYVFRIASSNNRMGSGFALVSSGVIMFIFLLKNLHYFGFIPPLKGILFSAYITFFFLQSIVLSYRFAFAWKRAAEMAQQGLQAKSDFLSTMSHEIRTPLNAVIGMTHVLKSNNPRDDQKMNLDVMLFSANNLLSLVNNILDYNKIEEGKISFENISMDLRHIARNIIAGCSSAAIEKGIELEVKIDEQLQSALMGDPTRLSQVIYNLVNNAIKFTRQGTVRLTIDVIETSSELITLEICVTDTGIGIEPAKLDMIFEKFTQADSSTSRNFGGTGLGLAICKKILELQGSRLMVNSEAGKGSKFYFTHSFALSREELKIMQQEPAAQQPEDKYPLKGLSILLAEDNAFNVLVAQTMLERVGATIEVAANGQEAIDKLDITKHHLVLMDLQMPVMDGYEATGRLRKRGILLPIIALTASMPNEVEQEVYAAGLTDIVVKPFNPDDLCRVLLQHVKKQENGLYN